MFLSSWIYNLIVQSRILHRFLWLLGPLRLMYLIKTHDGESITDEDGSTMKVTRWNGRAMAALGHGEYAKIEGLEMRQDDVIICGYPKSGCHWLHEILYMLMHRKPHVSKNGKIFEGMIAVLPEILLDSIPSPRILNTHVFYHELPKKTQIHKNKIVLTIRCPKDTVVSFFNHTKTLGKVYQYDGTFQNYFKMFVGGQVDFGSYFDFYRKWEEAMKLPESQNQIYFLSYEDLKEDPVAKIKEIADFVGYPVSQEFAERVADVTNFSKLKQKREGNALFRKGVVGDWKNWLTEEQSDEIDQLWKDKMDGFQMPAGSTRKYCQ